MRNSRKLKHLLCMALSVVMTLQLAQPAFAWSWEYGDGDPGGGSGDGGGYSDNDSGYGNDSGNTVLPDGFFADDEGSYGNGGGDDVVTDGDPDSMFGEDADEEQPTEDGAVGDNTHVHEHVGSGSEQVYSGMFDETRTATEYEGGILYSAPSSGWLVNRSEHGTSLSLYGYSGDICSTPDFELGGSYPWSSFADEIDQVIISGNIEHVGAYTFADLPCLTNVLVLTDTLRSFGAGCFANDVSLMTFGGRNGADLDAQAWAMGGESVFADSLFAYKMQGGDLDSFGASLFASDDDCSHRISYGPTYKEQTGWTPCDCCSKTVRVKTGVLSTAHYAGNGEYIATSSWQPVYGSVTLVCNATFTAPSGTTYGPKCSEEGCKPVYELLQDGSCTCGRYTDTKNVGDEIGDCPCGGDGGGGGGDDFEDEGPSGQTSFHTCSYTFTCIDLDKHIARCSQCGENYTLPHIWDSDDHEGVCKECGAHRVKVFAMARLQNTGAYNDPVNHTYDIQNVGSKWYLQYGTPTTTGTYTHQATFAEVAGGYAPASYFNNVGVMSKTSVQQTAHPGHKEYDDPAIANYAGTEGSASAGYPLMENNMQRVTNTWDRQTYTVTFNTTANANGNMPSQVTSQTILHDGYAIKPGDPTLTNYYFGGWYENKSCTGSPFNFSGTRITRNITLYAKWIPRGDTVYTIIYYMQNLTGQYIEGARVVLRGVADETATAEQRVYDGYTFNPSKSKQSGRITTDNNLVLEMYYDLTRYTVTFDTNGGTPSAIGSKQYNFGDVVDVPSVTQSGYVLDHWEATGSKTTGTWVYDFSSPVSENLHLKAIWVPEGSHVYTTTYYVENLSGTYEAVDTVKNYATVNTTVKAASRTYDGTTLNTEKSTLSGTIPAVGELQLSVYYKRNTYIVSFEGNGADDIQNGDPQTVYYGALAVMPTMTKAGYHVDHWEARTDSGATYTYDWKAPVVENLTIRPIWAPDNEIFYTVNNYVQGLDGEYTLYNNERKLSKVDETVKAEKFTLEGVYDDPTHENYQDAGVIPATGELVLNVYYTRYKYTVTFDPNTGAFDPGTDTEREVLHGNTVEQPGASKPGYDLVYWEATDDKGAKFEFTFGTPITGNLTIRPIWKAQGEHEYVVNYWVQNQKGEYEVYETLNLYGTVGKEVAADVKQFEGCYYSETDTHGLDKGTIPETGKLELHAYYARYKYTVKFDANGGNLDSGSLDDQQLWYGNKAAEPQLSIPGYVLDKWLAIDEKSSTFDWNYANPVTQNLTLKAIWRAEKEHEYLVNYWVQNQQGIYEVFESQNLFGTVDKEVTADVKQYEGVYVDKNHEKYKDHGVIPATGKLVLDVYYSRYEYTVKFDANGGSLTEASGVDLADQILYYGNKAVEPQLAIPGYILNKWIAIGEHGSTFTWDYANPVTQDLTLKAIWVPEDAHAYQVNYWVQDQVGKYEVFESQNLYGVVDETVFADVKQFEGVRVDKDYPGYKDRGVIPPTGKLILDVYYTRYQYKVNFDANGGKLADDSAVGLGEQTIFYGNKAAEPKLSIPGYVLYKWVAIDKNGSTFDWVYGNPVTEDLTLKAMWMPEGNHIYVTRHWVMDQSGTYKLYTSVSNYNEVDAHVHGDILDLNVLENAGVYFDTDYEGNVPNGVIPATGELVLDLYYTRHQYTVKFDPNGGNLEAGPTLDDQVIYHGNKAAEPKLSIPGYVLYKWVAIDESGSEFDWAYSNPVIENLTLKAMWRPETEHEYLVNYWVQSQEGEYEVYESQNLFSTVDKTVTADVKQFEGVYVNKSYPGYKESGVIPATGKLVLDIYYTRYQYTVKFDANGGNLTGGSLDDQTIFYGNKAAEPQLEIPGYVLYKWVAIDENGSTFDWDYANPVTENLTLKAMWRPEDAHEYLVNYWVQNQQGAYEVIESQNLFGTVDKTVTADVKTYEGVYVDKKYPGYKESGVIPATGKLVLDVYYTRYQYTVKLQANGGNLDSGSLDDQTIFYGNKAAEPQLSIPGYVLDKWLAIDENGSTFDWDYANPVTQDLTLKAIWVPEDAHAYQVNYWVQNQAGGYEIFEGENLYGVVDEKVFADVKQFEGVYVDKAYAGYADEGVIPATGKLVLNVYYTRYQYIVKFDANEGNLDVGSLADQTIFYGNKAAEPKLSIPGYILYKWVAIDENGSTFDWDYGNPVTENLTLKAMWMPEDAHEYLVNYWVQNKSGDYEVIESQNLFGTVDRTVTADVKTYDGVYVDKAHAGYKEEGVIPATGKLVLDVYYTRYQYTVKFDPAGGTLVDGSAADLGEQTIYYGNHATEPKLAIPGYVLKGWKAIADNGSEFDWSYANQVTENLTLKAVWEPAAGVSYRVEYWLMNKDGKTYTLEENLSGKGHTDEIITAELLKYNGFHLNDQVEGTKLTGAIPAEGVLVLSLYYDRDVFTVTMDPKNGEPVRKISVMYDCLVPEWNPEHFAWVFEGWMSASSMYDMASPVTNDLVLTAKWSDGKKVPFGKDSTAFMTDTGAISETDDAVLVENKALIDVGDSITIDQDRFEKTSYDKATDIITTDAEMKVHIDRDLIFDLTGGVIAGDRESVMIDGRVTVNEFTMDSAKGSVLHVDPDAMVDTVPGSKIVHSNGTVTTMKTDIPVDLRDGWAHVPDNGRLVRNGVDMLFPKGALVDLKSGKIILNEDQTVIIDPDSDDPTVITPPAGGGEIDVPGNTGDGDDDGKIIVPPGTEITVGGVTMTPDIPVEIDKEKGTVTALEDGQIRMKDDAGNDIILDVKKGDVLTCKDGHVSMDMDGRQKATFIIYNEDGSIKETVIVSESTCNIDINQPNGSWESKGQTNADVSYTDGADWNLKNDGMGMSGCHDKNANGESADGDIHGEDMTITRTGEDENSPQHITTEGNTILDPTGMTSTGETRVENPDGSVIVDSDGLHVNQDGTIDSETGTGTTIRKEDIIDENGDPAVKITIEDENGNKTIVITTGEYIVDETSRPEKILTDTTNGGYTTIQHINVNDSTQNWFVKTEDSKTETLPSGDSTVRETGENSETSGRNTHGWLVTTGELGIKSDGTITGTDGHPTKAHGETESGKITDVVNNGGIVTLYPDGNIDVQDGTGTVKTDDGKGHTEVTRKDPDGTEYEITNDGGKVEVDDNGDIRTEGGKTHIERESKDENGNDVHTEADSRGGSTEIDPDGNIITDNTKDINGDGKPDGTSTIVVDKTDDKGDPVHTEIENDGGKTNTDKSGNTVVEGGKTDVTTDTKDDNGNDVHTEIKNEDGKVTTDGNGNTDTDNTGKPAGKTEIVTDKTDDKGDPVHTEVTNIGGKTETNYNGDTITIGGTTVIITDTKDDKGDDVHTEIKNEDGKTETDGNGNTTTDNTGKPAGKTEIVTDKTDDKGDPVHIEVNNEGGKTDTDYNGNTNTTGGTTNIVVDTKDDKGDNIHTEITNNNGDTHITNNGDVTTDNSKGGDTHITVTYPDGNGDIVKNETTNVGGKTENTYNGDTITNGGDTTIIITEKNGDTTTIINNGGTTENNGDGDVITTGPTTVIDPDGNKTELPDGGEIHVPGDIKGPGNTITLDDGSKVTYPDDTKFNPDGSFEANGPITIIRPDGTRIYLPEGGKVYPDGCVETEKRVEMTYPDGSKVTVPKGDTKISPSDILKSDGNIDVDFADGRHVDMENGGEVHKEGSVESGEPIRITMPNGREIDLPDGGKMNKDGNIDVDRTQRVVVGGTTVTLPDSGGEIVVGGAGSLFVPNGGFAIDKYGKEYDLKWGGSVDNPTGRVTVYPNPNGDKSEAPDGHYMIYRDAIMNGGLLYVSHNYAKPGDIVTITAAPMSGYRLDQLVVTRNNGSSVVSMTRNGNTFTFTFTMPEYDVKLNALFVKTTNENGVPEGAHMIYRDAVTTGGSIYATHDYATQGTTVTVTAVAAEGYKLNSLTVTRNSGNGSVSLNRNGNTFVFTFQMPDYDVRLNSIFVVDKDSSANKGQYVINRPDGLRGGSLYVSHDKAAPGTMVTVTANARNSYALSRLAVARTDDGSIVPMTRSGNSFTFTFFMPNSDVTIGAAFIDADSNNGNSGGMTNDGSFNGNGGSNNGNNGNDGTFDINDNQTPLSGPFYGLSDLLPTDWYYAWLSNAIYRGYVDAAGKSMIEPNAVITRKEAAFTIKRLIGGQAAYSSSSAVSHYTDIGNSTLYSSEIAYNLDNGFMIGTGPSTFDPDANLTREQFALILYRIFGQYFVNGSHKDLNQFRDGYMISSWAKDAVQWAVDNNLMVGEGNGYMSPTRGVTRAEMATLVMRIALVLENKNVTGVIASVTPVAGVPVPPTIDVSDLKLNELTVRVP